MDAKLTSLLTEAFSKYLARRESGNLEPQLPYLPYDFENWHVQSLGGDMVKDQLNELTNILNGWKNALRRWHAWNLTLADYPDAMEAWDVRLEFLQPLVHQCLLEPSSVRDQITFVATNSVHQVRLATMPGYPDVLAGDPTPKKPKARFLTRPQKEEQLAGLISPWQGVPGFMSALQAIDGDEYVEATVDYRNRSSHALAPRLALGIVETVTRRVVPAKTLVQNDRGTFDEVEVDGKMSVQYGFGGMSPLDLEEARVANVEQFLKARHCYALYRQLLVMAGVGAGTVPPEPPNDT